MEDRGRLYICGTPIGNLEDISFRVLRILKEVDLIAAEDTRRTKKLLHYYEINTPMSSYHEHNELEMTERLIKELKAGKDIALVSDAGMPEISDPGSLIVKRAIKLDILVFPVPGPTALISALVVSGLSVDRFVFEGFIPRKGKERKSFLDNIESQERTIVFYESPYRLLDTLKELNKVLKGRKIAVVRELTKIHEEKYYGTSKKVYELLKDKEIKGEIVLVVEGRDKLNEYEEKVWKELSILEHLELLMENNYTKKEAIKEVAKLRNLSKSDVYKEAIAIEVNIKDN